MAELISQHQQAAFTVPINGTNADADEVRLNDNTLRGVYNAHDADAGVHVQSGTFASRPGAGVAGRKWLTTDGLRLYYDNGTTWDEVAYLSTGGGSVAGNLTINGVFTVVGTDHAWTSYVNMTGPGGAGTGRIIVGNADGTVFFRPGGSGLNDAFRFYEASGGDAILALATDPVGGSVFSGDLEVQGTLTGPDASGLEEVNLSTAKPANITEVAFSPGGNYTINATTGSYYKITTDGSTFTFNNPTGLVDGQSIIIMIYNSSGGSATTLSFGTAFIVPTNVADNVIAAGDSRAYHYIYVAADTSLCFVGGNVPA